MPGLFKLSVFASLALAVLALPGSPIPSQVRRCANELTNEQVQIMNANFASDSIGIQAIGSLAAPLNVYWHVISEDDTLEGGNIPAEQIDAQIATLNADYASSNIQWVLAGTTRTVNAQWFQTAGPTTPEQTAMKEALRQGGAADLNVYSVGFESGPGEGLRGYATFPQDYAGAPQEDGVVLLFSTVPGGATEPYDLGKTLVHEAGHWVGLFHTFEGGCDAPGDSVIDTPAEESPAFGCEVGRDTCLGDDDVDPIHNFMDYSDDACVDNFTPGQIERALLQLATYRGVPGSV